MDVVYSTYGGNKKCIQNCCEKNSRMRPVKRPNHRWDDNIKMNIKEIGFEDADKIQKLRIRSNSVHLWTH
jgi:hypothetical protein